MLLLGDPGTAKSQLLKFVEKVAPIGVRREGPPIHTYSNTVCSGEYVYVFICRYTRQGRAAVQPA